VLENHLFSRTDYNRRLIPGTSLNLSDDSVARVTAPFPIPFGGGSFTDLYVGSNGTISFTDPFAEFFNAGIPLSWLPVVTLVAPFWDDLYPIPQTEQNVFWDVTGTAPNRELVVEWRDVRSFSCRSDSSATVTFQVVFSENSSDIVFNYTDVDFGGDCTWQDRGASATIGIQVTPGKGTQWAYGETTNRSSLFDQSLADSTSILWQRESVSQEPKPVPTLTSLSPSSAVRGGPDFVLTLNGSGFVPTSRVHWGRYDRGTTFVSATQLKAVIPARDLEGGPDNPVSVTVVNLPPGGGTSNSLNFTITNPVPTLTSLSPSSATAGGLSFRLTLEGSGLTGSQVKWNGEDRLTVHYGNNKVVAGIPYGDIANPGTAQVTVVNAPPGGGTSNALTFTINSSTGGQASAAQSYLQDKQPPQPLYVGPEDKRPPASRNPTTPPPQPLIRFLGWNMAQTLGPAYLKRFPRARGRPVPALQNPMEKVTAEAGQGFSLLASSAPEAAGFELPSSLPTGFLPTGVVTGDFNRDGRMDWVVSNGGDSNLWLYLGRGDGTAELPHIIPLTGKSPVWLVAADLRGNGIVDLIVAEIDSGTVGVLLGHGDGTFAPEVTYYVPGPPTCVLAEDFNGDSHKDILVGLFGTMNTGPFALLPGDGTGRVGPPITKSSDLDTTVYWMTAGDLDKDGRLDLLTIALIAGNPGATSYRNYGDGTFKREQVLYDSGRSVALSTVLGDLNENGCLDAIVLTSYGLAWVFLGDGAGHFQDSTQARVFGEGDVGYGLGLAHLNGDGHLDLVTSGVFMGVDFWWGTEAGNLLCVLFGNGRGNFGRPTVYRGETSAFALALGDLNQDGHPDVVAANLDSDSATTFLNDGRGGGQHYLG